MSDNLSTPHALDLPTDSRQPPIDFLELVTTIRHYARRSFSRLDPESREEAEQEVVANCFVAYRRLVERCKQGDIAAIPLARFAVAQTRAGRRVGGRANIHDISSPYCQYRQRIAQEYLAQLNDASGAWEQILIEDPSSTPADIVAIRLDFQSWLDSLPQRQRQIAEVLSTGETTYAVARLFNVTPGRISQVRHQLKAAWNAFQSDAGTAPAVSA